MEGKQMAQRILITGGTGFIGAALCRKLRREGFDIVLLSRSPEHARDRLGSGFTVVDWDGQSSASWKEYADGAFAIINLAGENIASHVWTEKRKHQILQSRLDAGRSLVEAIQAAKQKPHVLVQASGIGFYGSAGEQELGESSPCGRGFLADTSRQWEASTETVEALAVRRVVIRLGVVLGPDGGFLGRITPAFRLFLGGRIGNGRQWLSCIHRDDVINAICFLIREHKTSGVYNLVSPQPLRSGDFYRLLGKVLARPALFCVPAVCAKLVLGQMAEELILASQKILPRRLLAAGFTFRFPQIEEALRNIYPRT